LSLAFAFSVAEYVPAFHVVSFAPVVHQWDLRLGNLERFLLDIHVGAIFYDVTILTLKLAILIQFLRIFIPDRNFLYWATHALIWLNTIFYIVMLFVQLFACRPLEAQWDPLIVSGKCVDIPLTFLISQSFNFVLDILILIWTQVIIWRLHMPVAQKMKLAVLFIAGFLGVAAAAVSIYMNAKIFGTTDQTFWSALNALMTFPETTSGFLVLGLPVVPKFVAHIRTHSTLQNEKRRRVGGMSAWTHSAAGSAVQTAKYRPCQLHDQPLYARIGQRRITTGLRPCWKRECTRFHL
jgi:hypothetical protein